MREKSEKAQFHKINWVFLEPSTLFPVELSSANKDEKDQFIGRNPLEELVAILIGLSLAESEIEVIHDHGDTALTRLLVSNRLLVDADLKAAQALGQDIGVELPRSEMELLEENALVGSNNGPRSALSGGDFALFLSPPQLSFALLIAAEFLILLAFLAVLIYFVRVCEKAEEARKEMRRAETSQI
ncbi:unnamed protein product [Echinostoma caproni]|uniref:DUF3568 family protein n=1 Tax=Echinostoma caproni TaxID=27848 RepID=A0A183ALY9_9TREM|nr:unnamed protein product [Echinostoma caproni]